MGEHRVEQANRTVGGEGDERIEEQGLQEVIAAVGEESVARESLLLDDPPHERAGRWGERRGVVGQHVVPADGGEGLDHRPLLQEGNLPAIREIEMGVQLMESDERAQDGDRLLAAVRKRLVMARGGRFPSSSLSGFERAGIRVGKQVLGEGLIFPCGDRTSRTRWFVIHGRFSDGAIRIALAPHHCGKKPLGSENWKRHFVISQDAEGLQESAGDDGVPVRSWVDTIPSKGRGMQVIEDGIEGGLRVDKNRLML